MAHLKTACNYCHKAFVYDTWKSKGAFCTTRCYWNSKKGIFPKHTGVTKKDYKCQDCKVVLNHNVKATKRCRSCYIKVMPTALKGIPKQKLRGRKHWNWQGGKSRKRRDLTRVEYKQWRDKVFHKDNYTCQICFQYGGTLHADHIIKWSENIDKRYDVDNGRTLCVPCHYYITFKKVMPLNSSWCNYTRKRG